MPTRLSGRHDGSDDIVVCRLQSELGFVSLIFISIAELQGRLESPPTQHRMPRWSPKKERAARGRNEKPQPCRGQTCFNRMSEFSVLQQGHCSRIGFQVPLHRPFLHPQCLGPFAVFSRLALLGFAHPRLPPLVDALSFGNLDGRSPWHRAARDLPCRRGLRRGGEALLVLPGASPKSP